MAKVSVVPKKEADVWVECGDIVTDGVTTMVFAQVSSNVYKLVELSEGNRYTDTEHPSKVAFSIIANYLERNGGCKWRLIKSTKAVITIEEV